MIMLSIAVPFIRIFIVNLPRNWEFQKITERDEIEEQNQIAPDAVQYARDTFYKLVAAAEGVGLPANPELRDSYVFQALMNALEISSDSQKEIYSRLESAEHTVTPVYRPKATIERVAPLRLDQSVSDLVTTLTEVRQSLENVRQTSY